MTPRETFKDALMGFLAAKAKLHANVLLHFPYGRELTVVVHGKKQIGIVSDIGNNGTIDVLLKANGEFVTVEITPGLIEANVPDIAQAPRKKWRAEADF